MKNIKTIRQEDGKGGGGAGGGPRNLRKAKLAKCAFYGERPYFLSCTETLSLESPFLKLRNEVPMRVQLAAAINVAGYGYFRKCPKS